MNDVKCKSGWIVHGGNGENESEDSFYDALTFCGADEKRGLMNRDCPALRNAMDRRSVGPTSIPPRPPISTGAMAEGLEGARDIEGIDVARRTITTDEPWRASRTCGVRLAR